MHNATIELTPNVVLVQLSNGPDEAPNIPVPRFPHLPARCEVGASTNMVRLSGGLIRRT
jgi:hypothetical protein